MPFIKFISCINKSKFVEIDTLKYSHNNLSHVPEEIIVHERALEELHLDANRITELPRWLFQCHGLRVLNLNDNEFQTLPSAISSLINLEHLDISKNGFQQIPDNIKYCRKLKVVDASLNPIGK
jgi:Leucine-rich repeat (LRR) protein